MGKYTKNQIENNKYWAETTCNNLKKIDFAIHDHCQEIYQ